MRRRAAAVRRGDRPGGFRERSAVAPPRRHAVIHWLTAPRVTPRRRATSAGRIPRRTSAIAAQRRRSSAARSRWDRGGVRDGVDIPFHRTTGTEERIGV